MVIYLIPGLTGAGASTTDTYATIYPHWYSHLLSTGVTVSQELVSKRAAPAGAAALSPVRWQPCDRAHD